MSMYSDPFGIGDAYGYICPPPAPKDRWDACVIGEHIYYFSGDAAGHRQWMRMMERAERRYRVRRALRGER